ncbi:MAG: hypothetical protein J7M40_02805 [Planctomycetes bacterium]|nr:hypothetical protein [Planctomycetota bacterium]
MQEKIAGAAPGFRVFVTWGCLLVLVFGGGLNAMGVCLRAVWAELLGG